jgi:hypothetical protein
MDKGTRRLHACNSSFACDVIAAMLEDDNKRFDTSFFCIWYQHGLHVFVFGFSWEWLQTKNRLNTLESVSSDIQTPDREAGWKNEAQPSFLSILAS